MGEWTERRRTPVVFAVAAVLASGCELTEVTIAEPEDVVIAEGQVVVTPAYHPEVVGVRASVLLHRSFTDADPEVPGANVTIASGRRSFPLTEVPLDTCLVEGLSDVEGSCYSVGSSVLLFQPGEELFLRIETPDGRVLEGVSRIPGAFSLTGLSHEDGRCRLRPETNYRLRWTPSEGTWAYVGEATITRLDVALAPRGIEAPEALFLNGLSIGQEDTEIVFPKEFGIFDRFDLERDLAVALQAGLPEGAGATVAVSALDRNWVNWARGGNFNPSGAVRIPSVFGDGTGVFGTAVRLLVAMRSSTDETLAPLCGPPEAGVLPGPPARTRSPARVAQHPLRESEVPTPLR